LGKICPCPTQFIVMGEDFFFSNPTAPSST
jgi:hypothetical protein